MFTFLAAPAAPFVASTSSQLSGWAPSTSTTLMIGAVLGLLVFAFSYALRVVSARRGKHQGAPMDMRERAIRTAGLVLVAGGIVVGATMLLGDGAFHERAEVQSRDLFAVMPRVGLFPEFIDVDDEVPAYEPVMRFLRVDDVHKEIRDLQERRDRLQNELALLEARPLSLDPVIMGEYQRAETALKSLDSRARELADEQAVLARELATRKLERDSRRMAIVKELRNLDNDIEEVRGRLATSDAVLADARTMLEEGLISRSAFAEREQELGTLRNSMQTLRDQRYMLEMEAAELDTLYARSESSYETQLAMRAEVAEGSDDHRAKIVAQFSEASLAKEQEQGRAARQRDLEIETLRGQITECERRLEDPLGAAVVSAPWSGRIGYRDPSPMSLRPGQGPLLVMYRPGTIWAEIRIGDRADITAESECSLTWIDPTTNRTIEVPGRVAGAPEGKGRHATVTVVCDPPAKAVAMLAMDKPVIMDVAITPVEQEGSALKANMARIAIPTGLAMLLLRPRRRRDEDNDDAHDSDDARGRARARARRQTEQEAARQELARRRRRAVARAEAAAYPKARAMGAAEVDETAMPAFADEGMEDVAAEGGLRAAAAAGGSVAADLGATEYRPPARDARAVGAERLLAWLPSAIRAHDLPRQVMSRLHTLDAVDAFDDPAWDEVEADDVRAAALDYLTRAAGRGVDTASLMRLAAELHEYCELTAVLVDVDAAGLRAEILATLNGIMLAAGVASADRTAILGNLDLNGSRS
jgi:hypothetical protein